MWPLIKSIFTDETAFVGYFRAIMLGLGSAVTSGVFNDILPSLPPAVGVLMVASAGFVRSSSHTKAELAKRKS